MHPQARSSARSLIIRSPLVILLPPRLGRDIATIISDEFLYVSVPRREFTAEMRSFPGCLRPNTTAFSSNARAANWGGLSLALPSRQTGGRGADRVRLLAAFGDQAVRRLDRRGIRQSDLLIDWSAHSRREELLA